MLQKIFYFFIFPAALILTGVAVYFIVFKPSPTTPPDNRPAVKPPASSSKNSQEKTLPEVTVKKPEITHLTDGKAVWKVSAESIVSDPKKGEASLKGSSGEFFRNRRDKTKRLIFTAPNTVYNAKTKTVTVQGKVKGTLLPENCYVEAEDMSWDEKSGALNANKVLVTANGATIRSGHAIIRKEEKTLEFSSGTVIEIPTNTTEK